MASLIFIKASSTVSPSDIHPGNAGTVETYVPFSSFSRTTVYLKYYIDEDTNINICSVTLNQL